MEPTPGAYIRLGNLAAGFSTTDISREGKPGDAVFKALAIVPMTGLAPSVVRKVPPFDPDELIRLIKQESEA